MEEHERIQQSLDQWKRIRAMHLHPREVNFDLFTKTDHVIDVIGARRAGKTSILILAAREIEKKHPVFYVNFEDRMLYPLTVGLLDDLILRAGDRKAYLFLDEIQNVPGWERWARNVYDARKGQIKIVVSGSSSKLIRKDIATILTGRHIPLTVFPLGFREFRAFTRDADIKDYLAFGGFPEVALLETPELKEEVLKAYYEDILYKDVLQKYAIQEKTVLENFVKFLFMNISGYFSYKRGKEYLDALGIPTSTRTLLRYTGILEEVFLFFFVPIFARKVREQAKYPKKEYAVDIGLRNVVYPGEDFGKKAENVVYLELRRRGGEINYWKSKEGNEVDFIIRNGHAVHDLIQVAWELHDEMTRLREIQALVLAMKEFGKKEGTIITYEKEEIIHAEGCTITVIPLKKWLLEGKEARTIA